MSRQRQSNHSKKWTPREEERLLQQVRVFPQNLHACFIIVAEVIGRTPGAVANHWYTVTSKKAENMCFFTASPKHVSPNRKNGMGTRSNMTIWRRLIRTINSLFN